MKLKVFELMFLISKNDKKTWENYIANFHNFSIDLQNNKNSNLNKKTKVFLKNSISSKQLNSFKHGKAKPEGVIDLHGYRLYNAKIALQKYIVNAYEKNIRNILIITGKGHNNRGILKREVPLWLNDQTLMSLLVNFEIAPKEFGGEGALLVKIKKKKKKTSFNE